MGVTLPRSWRSLADVAAKAEHSKFGAMTAVHLRVKAGQLLAEATDGRILVRVTGPTECTDEFDTFIPGDVWRNAFDEYGTVEADGLGVMCTRNYRNYGLRATLTFPKVEGRYPDIDQVIPTGMPTAFAATVDARRLGDLCAVLAELTSVEVSHRTVLEILADKHMVKLTGKTEDDFDVVALIVQIVSPEEAPGRLANEIKAKRKKAKEARQ